MWFSNETRIGDTSTPNNFVVSNNNPNAGQYGWTNSDNGYYNQLIQYVDECRQISEHVDEVAAYIDSIASTIGDTKFYYDQTVLVYNSVVQIQGDITDKYGDFLFKYTDFLTKYGDFNTKYSDFLIKYGTINSSVASAATSASQAATSAANALDAYNDTYDIYLELREGQVYRGTWNPNTNAYPNAQGTNSIWDVVLNSGQLSYDFDGKTWRSGDRVVYVLVDNSYQQLATASGVSSVNGKTGSVSLTYTDVNAAPTGFGLGVTGPAMGTQSQFFSYGALPGSGEVPSIGAGFQSTSATNRRAQAYVGITGQFYSRFSSSATVLDNTTPWNTHYTTANKPTALDVGAVSKTGDTMNGRLNIVGAGVDSSKSQVRVGLTDNVWRAVLAVDNTTNQTLLGHSSSGAETLTSYLSVSDTNLRYKSASLPLADVYTTQNKPNAVDVGALPITGGTLTGQLNLRGASVGIGSYGLAQGGVSATMYTRSAPYVTEVTHSGSSYAPSLKMIYHYTSSGYNGTYSIGHLTTNASNPGALMIHHIDANNGSENYWTFDGTDGGLFLPTDPQAPGHAARKSYVDTKLALTSYKPRSGSLDRSERNTVVAPAGNMNSLVAGDFNLYQKSIMTNAPTLAGAYYYGETKSIFSTSALLQMTYPYDGAGALEFRNYSQNSSSWSPWRTVYDTLNKPTPADIGAVSVSPTATDTSGTATYVVSAPAGASAGTWYPVLVYVPIIGGQVTIGTNSGGSGLAMNHCSFNGYIKTGGFTDRGTILDGQFFIYQTTERSIASAHVPTESSGFMTFYVEARAFPVTVICSSGVNPPLAGSSISSGTSIFTATSAPDSPSGTNTAVNLIFNNGGGRYSSSLNDRMYYDNTAGANGIGINLPDGLYSVLAYVGDGGNYRVTYMLEVDRTGGATIFKSTKYDATSWTNVSYNSTTQVLTSEGSGATRAIYKVRRIA